MVKPSQRLASIDEGVAAFIKGINNSPEEEKDGQIELAKEQIKNLSVAMISLFFLSRYISSSNPTLGIVPLNK